ncbi:DUF2478 domain-containing protein [Thauera sp. WH-1]|uniref:DUF2478 domain-containing protein n=1 Tax=Thauera sp. WH-1 TaxID=3398230 RepID=UPI0039FCDF02
MSAHAIAAVVYKPTDNIEALLAEAARTLAARGIKLGGVLQHDIASVPDDPCAMELENLETGESIPLSQDLGSGSVSCRVDPDALARGSIAVRGALSRGAQLIIINKFGAQEAFGAGLRDEMGEAVLAGVPLLTAVGERFLDDWAQFTGGECSLLPPALDAILGWWSELQTGG